MTIPMSGGPPQTEWENVAFHTQRLAVPGGWLYRYGYASSDGCMVFVPAPVDSER